MLLKLRILKKYGLLILFSIASSHNAFTQAGTYKDSILSFRKNYVDSHEVVGENDRQYLHFYDVDRTCRVTASFKRITDPKGFDMNTSSGSKERYFLYGLLTFKLHGSLLHLFVYQSASLLQQEKYKSYLFVPSGDATSGFESYGGGRYLEFYIADIKHNLVVLDFNKVYNPYCAYATGYNCPVPPKENILKVPIAAGEKTYGKPLH